MESTLLEATLRRDRVVVTAALAASTLLAWAYVVWLARGMTMPTAMSGAVMAASTQPWTATQFGLTFVMWAVMMIGMMTPSATPMILIYARVARQATTQGRPLAATGFFAMGYLLAWTAFSFVATLGQWALQHALLLTPMMASASTLLSGLVLITAGAFQWTPIKHACLRNCQAPWFFIQRHGGFRAQPSGSVGLGFRHGIYCVGCCWALMALLFVGGVMNILWIAVISIFVLAEKVVPAGRWFPYTAGALLTAWGVWLLVAAAIRT